MPAALTRVLADQGITVPTPIQAATLADSVAGRDVLGRGRTGSGKTYAFLLPLVARLSRPGSARRPRHPRALILAPTRELVGQIETALKPLAQVAGLTTTTVFGGVSQSPQVRALRTGVDVVLACPGRLEDLIAQGVCSLADVEITVLDEADHMADLGFLPAVTRLLSQTPANGQRLLFSATLDRAVDGLVRRFLRRPATHEADSVQSPVSAMDHHVLHIPLAQRTPVVADLASAPGRMVVFTRTKSRAKSLTRQLNAQGIPAVELHGNLNQNARDRNMKLFQSGDVATLVATDIAARGIHVDDVELVVHADPPVEHKAYLHRSGRTARAGKAGTVVTLMTDDQARDVRSLTKAAGVRPTTTRVDTVANPILAQLAPGQRRRSSPTAVSTVPATAPRSTSAGRPDRRGPSSPRTSERSKPASERSGKPHRGRASATASASAVGRGHSAARFSSRSRRG
ncbi:MAG TPA: DEAD/DEAH box helicase [Propionibacteriaceae bacterium]|nr:DEAD/DEAH box helicase [Propionibacteriaceae bacterium]